MLVLRCIVLSSIPIIVSILIKSYRVYLNVLHNAKAISFKLAYLQILLHKLHSSSFPYCLRALVNISLPTCKNVKELSYGIELVDSKIINPSVSSPKR